MIQKTGIDNFRSIYWLRDQYCMFDYFLVGKVGWYYDTFIETKTEEYRRWKGQVSAVNCDRRFYINIGFVI